MKTVTYFPLQCALNSGPVISAVMESLQTTGIQIKTSSYDADIAVIWSVLWHGRMIANQDVYRYYRSKGRPVVCIEVGALDRGRTWKLALNHVNALGHYGHQIDLDPDRPKKLGISLKTNTLNHNRVLVAGQHNRSLQLEGVDQEAWYVQKINEVANGKQVVVRPHPRCPMDRSRFPKTVVWEQPCKLANTYDSFDMHWDFDAVINYNSGPGIQATIAGVPAVVDFTSLAYNVIDREQWLIEICHTEYTLEEIRQGTWVKRIGLEP
jgi:hypothetical protein